MHTIYETSFHLCIYLSILHTGAIILKYPCEPTPMGFYTGREKCIKYFYLPSEKQVTSFKDREAECIVFGAKMATIKTKKQLDALILVMDKSEKQIMLSGFIEGARQSLSSTYRWSDGEIISDDLWTRSRLNSSENNKKCVAVDRSEMGLIEAECTPTMRLRHSCEVRVPVSMLTEDASCPIVCSSKFNLSCAHSGICPNDSMKLYKIPSEEICDLKPCSSFRYGPLCEFQCFCKDFAACHIETGRCPTDECEPGWFGKACNVTACSIPLTYGDSCDKVCRCSNKQACFKDDGSCAIGCMAGLTGRQCSILEKSHCQSGRCGSTCMNTCGACSEGNCTQKDCTCPSLCTKGWSGIYCTSTVCPRGTWGAMCEKYCFCEENTSCHADTGWCPKGCVPGWQGNSCNESCAQQNRWGPGCAYTCNCVPKLDAHCNKETGACPNEYVHLKREDCPNNTWGRYCDKPCDNDLCLVCARNSRGKKCSECLPGLFWTDGICAEECLDQLTYGKRCSIKCSDHCAERGYCESDTGKCTRGCSGIVYTGPRCTEYNLRTFTVVFVVSILLCCYCVYCGIYIEPSLYKSRQPDVMKINIPPTSSASAITSISSSRSGLSVASTSTGTSNTST